MAVFPLASILSIGAAPRPRNLGLQDYGSFKTVNLCPPTPNCISTAEVGREPDIRIRESGEGRSDKNSLLTTQEANDFGHYVPPLSYNPPSRKNKASKKQAMDELYSVVSSLRPDNFTPK